MVRRHNRIVLVRAYCGFSVVSRLNYGTVVVGGGCAHEAIENDSVETQVQILPVPFFHIGSCTHTISDDCSCVAINDGAKLH